MKMAAVLPKGWCQALAEALKKLCCTPGCCSVLPQLLCSSQQVLGTLQILVGVVNMGLGPGRISTRPGDLTQLGAPYWLGIIFLVSGIMCVLAGCFPTAGLVGVTVFMNLSAAVFAITGIVLYAIDLSNTSLAWMCRSHRHYAARNHGYVAVEKEILNQEFDEKCIYFAQVAEGLLTMMDILLIVFAVLQLCVNISASVLGIKALMSLHEKSWPDVERKQPQLDSCPLVTQDEACAGPQSPQTEPLVSSSGASHGGAPLPAFA